jgi:hypothetical protein
LWLTILNLVLAHVTENRKIEVCKPLIFQEKIFKFCLKNAHV